MRPPHAPPSPPTPQAFPSLVPHLTQQHPLLQASRPSDFLELASWIGDEQGCLWWAGPRIPYPFAPAQLLERLAADDWVSRSLCNAEGALLGFGQYRSLVPGLLHLGRLIIAPTHRGNGWIDHLVLGLANEGTLATGARRVALRVFRENTAAVKAYQRLGFAEDPLSSTALVSTMEWDALA